MLDKYFGFLKVQDEYTILDSLIEHTRIDEEEIELLTQMVNILCQENSEKTEEVYTKIRKIHQDSRRIFEHTAEQIIQANFDHQKQYDLLRLYQRIESISGYIVATAKRVVLLHRIGGSLPKELHPNLKELIQSIKVIHNEFKTAVIQYTKDKKKLIPTITKIEEMEQNIDHIRAEGLEILYKLANQDKLQLGTFKAIENIIEHIETTSDVVDEAAKSLEWLLIT